MKNHINKEKVKEAIEKFETAVYKEHTFCETIEDKLHNAKLDARNDMAKELKKELVLNERLIK